MSRRTFADVLQGTGVDFDQEYGSLWRLFYGGDDQFLDYDSCSFADLVASDFLRIPFRGSSVSLDDFDRRNGFAFADHPSLVELVEGQARGSDEKLDMLVMFCEYVFNLAQGFESGKTAFSDSLFTREWELDRAKVVQDQVLRIAEKIAYERVEKGDLAIFVPRDEVVNTAAELMNPEPARQALAYGHHSMNGDLEGKRAVILALAQEMERKRSTLSAVSKSYASDLFFLLNNLDIRHDNSGENPPFSKAPGAALLDDSALEEWYDKVYRMCIGAFVLCDYGAIRGDIASMKKPE